MTRLLFVSLRAFLSSDLEKETLQKGGEQVFPWRVNWESSMVNNIAGWELRDRERTEKLCQRTEVAAASLEKRGQKGWEYHPNYKKPQVWPSFCYPARDWTEERERKKTGSDLGYLFCWNFKAAQSQHHLPALMTLIVDWFCYVSILRKNCGHNRYKIFEKHSWDNLDIYCN